MQKRGEAGHSTSARAGAQEDACRLGDGGIGEGDPYFGAPNVGGWVEGEGGDQRLRIFIDYAGLRSELGQVCEGRELAAQLSQPLTEGRPQVLLWQVWRVSSRGQTG